MIEELVRPHLKDFKPYVSARSEALEARIFLDANELTSGSPLAFDGPPLNRYPDPNQWELRERLAGMLGVGIDSLFVGVGSDEIIDLLIRLVCEPQRDSIAILEPTYGVYRVAAELNGVEALAVELDDRFQIDVAKTLSAVRQTTKLLFCCSPNNPTGNLLDREQIMELCRSFRGVVVADEAYIEFSGAASLAEMSRRLRISLSCAPSRRHGGLLASGLGIQSRIRKLFPTCFELNRRTTSARRPPR